MGDPFDFFFQGEGSNASGIHLPCVALSLLFHSNAGTAMILLLLSKGGGDIIKFTACFFLMIDGRGGVKKLVLLTSTGNALSIV